MAAACSSNAAEVDGGAGAAGEAASDLALMGTVPIFWGEAAGLEELIGGDQPAHWARKVLEREYGLAPLDYLDAEALAPHSQLLLAQPRALAPEENVALDQWVRQGGRLLLFADPMMTGESRFGIGDRRRPQDVALLSPILAHWGLRLEFDGEQELGVTMREIAGRDVPVNLPGRFAIAEDRGDAACRLGGEALLARCTPGEGQVVLVADAALLDFAGPWPNASEALELLTGLAFESNGEFAGE